MKDKEIYEIVDWTEFADVPTRSIILCANSRAEALSEYKKTYYPNRDLEEVILVASRVFD